MPPIKPALPIKYYHSHFNEFISYISQKCQHLLDSSQQRFIHQYQNLSENTQCMLVRVINRRGDYIQPNNMIYHEILDTAGQITLLTDQHFLRELQHKDVPEWLTTLTKIQLVQLLVEHPSGIEFKKSASKNTLSDLAKCELDTHYCLTSNIAKLYRVNTSQDHINYFLFLFFGNLSSALDKFSMRDMGLIKTHQQVSTFYARFENIQESQSAFYYAKQLAKFKEQHLLGIEHAYGTSPEQYKQAFGPRAKELKAQYFYLLGKSLLANEPDLALCYLQASESPKAQEKWLREQYKQGNKSLVKSHLEKIIDTSLDDMLLLFAQDFYQRKYQKVRVSKLTQKLREESYSISIDQIHQNQVEKGVQQYYQRQGDRVFRTENRLFNTLFGLTFWQELFNHEGGAVSTEFDRRPKLVKDNTIYTELESAIEQRLLLYIQPKKALSFLTKMASNYYGQPNGMFRWHTKMLDVIGSFLSVAPPTAVISHLRAMSKNYQGLNDGYPDLMRITQNTLQFIEVKAPGDVIRANQFVTMNALQQSGFDVSVGRVRWCVDPNQPYVVVDIETTGGKQPQHRITEIAAVKLVDGKVVDTWTSLINPQRHISQFITRLTGIDNKMVEDAPLFCEIAQALLDFMQGCIFVAHNVNFDYGFIKQEYQRIDRKFSMPKLCTVRETRQCFPGLSSYSLGKLCKHFDISLVNHHRALCDAQATTELLKLILQRKNTQQFVDVLDETLN